MKTVLFIAPSFYNYTDIIIELIENVLHYKVIYINLGGFHYSYKHFYERIWNNIYCKPFKKEDIKNIKKSEQIIMELEKMNLEEIEIIFYIKPLTDHIKLIEYLKKLNKKMIGHQWDSLKSLNNDIGYFKYFDRMSSFDFNDCQKYNMRFIPNFYFSKIPKIKECEYDAFTIMTYDYRFSQLENLAKQLKNDGRKYLFLVYQKNKTIENEFVTLIDKPISLEEIYDYISKSKSIVEIGHVGKQGGLSFRALDSLGCEKKLITNYNFIKEYDFYNENNIFIINDLNVSIPKNFF